MKILVAGVLSFAAAALYFYGLDYFLMSVQGLDVGMNLMPR